MNIRILKGDMAIIEELEQRIESCRKRSGADQKTHYLASPQVEVCPYSIGYVIKDANGEIIVDHRSELSCPEMSSSIERKGETDSKTVWHCRLCRYSK